MVKREGIVQVTLRLPESLDKEIREVAKTLFMDNKTGVADFSKAIRFLTQLGLMVNKRINEQLIREIIDTLEIE